MRLNRPANTGSTGAVSVGPIRIRVGDVGSLREVVERRPSEGHSGENSDGGWWSSGRPPKNCPFRKDRKRGFRSGKAIAIRRINRIMRWI